MNRARARLFRGGGGGGGHYLLGGTLFTGRHYSLPQRDPNVYYEKVFVSKTKELTVLDRRGNE